MVPGNGHTQIDKDRQRNIVARVLSRLFRWCSDGLIGFVRFFRDIGIENSQNRLILTIVDLTEKDQLVWQDVGSSEVEAFETSSDDTQLRLEVVRSRPTLFTQHGDVRSAIVKSDALNILVQVVFKQEARLHRQREISSFDPDEEFRRLLLGRYREFVKKRP